MKLGIDIKKDKYAFKYNNLYRFNKLKRNLNVSQYDLNTTICIGSIDVVEVGKTKDIEHLNTTICIGSIRVYNGSISTFINLNTTICIGSI